MFPARSLRRHAAWRRRAAFVVLVWLTWFLRIWELGDLALVRDEAYFYQWGRHLDWAYYDHPAGTGVLVWLSTALAGASEFGVRWLNVAMGTLGVVLTVWVGRMLLGRKVGLLGAAAVAVGAPYLLTSRILYTDALHLVSVLLTVGTFWLLAQHRGERLIDGFALGLSLALMVNTKYTGYLVALALATVTFLDHRYLLTRRATWWAVGLGAIGLVPVLAWNARHGWASFAWQLGHLGLTSPGSIAVGVIPQVIRNLRHAVAYFTWPLVLLASVGLTALRGPAQRLLLLVAMVIIAPVALSPANSPRNLTTGTVLLLLLAVAQLMRWQLMSERSFIRKLAALALSIGLIGEAVYGIGSLAALTYDLPGVPQSSVIQDILYEAAGWKGIASRLPRHGSILTIDYSLAAHMAYYTGRPTISAWHQYRLWGTPDLDDVVVVALTYLPADVIETQLHIAYREVRALAPVAIGSHGEQVRWLQLWQATGRRLPPDELLDRVDFLTLYAESQ